MVFQVILHCTKTFLNWIQVWAVWWKEQKFLLALVGLLHYQHEHCSCQEPVQTVGIIHRMVLFLGLDILEESLGICHHLEIVPNSSSAITPSVHIAVIADILFPLCRKR